MLHFQLGQRFDFSSTNLSSEFPRWSFPELLMTSSTYSILICESSPSELQTFVTTGKLSEPPSLRCLFSNLKGYALNLERAFALAQSSPPNDQGHLFPYPFEPRLAFFVIGTSGKIRIQTCPSLFMYRVTAIRAASICREVNLPISRLLIPKVPNANWLPRCANAFDSALLLLSMLSSSSVIALVNAFRPLGFLRPPRGRALSLRDHHLYPC